MYRNGYLYKFEEGIGCTVIICTNLQGIIQTFRLRSHGEKFYKDDRTTFEFEGSWPGKHVDTFINELKGIITESSCYNTYGLHSESDVFFDLL